MAASLKGSDPDVPTRVRSILHLFDKPFHIEWTRIRLDAHAGSVTEAHGINNPLQTLQQAELAARQAVRGGLPWAVYSDQHQQVESERLELLGDLDHAIESGEVKPYYQPYLDLRPREPLLKGVESLARWIHPERGVLTPATFIAIAEESELIQGLTRCMVQETVHQLRTWADAGWRPEVSINLSTRNLPRKDLPDLLSRCVLEGGLKPEDFTLEITENLFIHHYEDSRDCLIRLHEMGFRLAIDDFGTGFSSLTYLKRLPVDRIKIDQSFVRDLLEDATDREIVQTIIGLAHRLHTEVLAEGVERNDQFELLRSLGCELVQGYFLTPPLPADQLRAWISQSGWATDSGTGGRPL